MVVFIESEKKGRWENLAPPVVTGLNDSKLGNTIPKATVTSPDMQNLWGSMSYKQMNQDQQFRVFKKQINAIREGVATPEVDPKRDFYWPVKGKDGFYIGAFREIKPKGTIILQNASGKFLHLNPASLTDEAVRYAKKLTGVEEAPAAESKVEPVIEDWTSSEGKTIRAKFLALADGRITLELSNGKTATLPLSRLCEASQARAKELGSE